MRSPLKARSRAKKILMISLLSSIILPFQNCSQTQLEAISPSSEAPETTELIFNTQKYYYNSLPITIPYQITPSNNGYSTTCLLNNSNSNCSSTNAVVSSLNDGTHSLQISVSESNRTLIVDNFDFILDRVAPSITVTSTPQVNSGLTSATFIFSSSDSVSGVASVSCSLNGAEFSICSSPYNLSSLAEGSQNFRIRASDKADNVSTIYSFNWSISTQTPSVSITNAPTASSNNTNASITFSGSNVASFECRINTNSFLPCSSPHALTNLGPNSNILFEVRGVTHNNTRTQSASVNWIVDTTAPNTPNITSNINNYSTTTTAQFTFTSTDNLSGIGGYECSLNNGSYLSCVSPANYSNLPSGLNTFRVRARDNANNISVIQTTSWVIDQDNPIITITSSPPGSTTSTSASFQFTVDDPNSGVAATTCSLNGASFASCSSPWNTTGLSLGNHQFRIRAIDNAGNSVTNSYSWTIIAEPPPPSNSITAIMTATRISGPAPLAILFNASSSSDSLGGSSFKDLIYSFDAGDNNNATYAVTGQLKRRHSGGPLFSYVYETPSASPYIAKVRVQNSSGQWSEAQVEITVTDPNSVYSGSNTICIGNPIPTAGVGGCPSGAQTRTTLIDGSSYSNKRVLLRRGETFAGLSINNLAADVIVGAFGSGNAPTVSYLYIGSGAGGATPVHPTRVSVSDLIVTGDFGGPVSGSDVLVQRVQHTASGSSYFDFGATTIGYWRSNPPGGWNSSHFPEPRRLFYFENSISASGAYGALLDSAIVGNTFHAQSPAQHSVRVWRAIRSYFAHNHMGRVGDNIRHSFKLHSGGTRDCVNLDVNSIFTDDCATSKVVIANNVFGHASNANDWTVALRPENTISSQGMEDVITENNSFIRGTNTSVDLLVVGRNFVDRGNTTSTGGSIYSNSGGTSTNNCSGYPMPNSWCGPYFLSLPSPTPNWPTY